ncbi:MAG: hypothetical protein CMP18_03035 [Rickettsiales bacterium]|nr:hypothetical protein [Rickettsiales bacterium]|tara:strand:+ start:29886 stop:33743 length:3858 start_codon:yes stop_codon:yes gene_type:complete
MGLSNFIKLAENENVINYSDTDDTVLSDKYQYKNEAIEALYQKTLDFAVSLNDKSKDQIATFVRELFYIEDIDQQSLHSVFKSLSDSISNNKLETLNNLLEIFILKGENIEGSLIYSVNLSISSYDTAKTKAVIFDDYFEKLFQVLDLLYSNFSCDDKHIESVFYYFPITNDHNCFAGSFERLTKTFNVLNSKTHQAIQSSVEFKEGLLDQLALKYMGAIQIDDDSMRQDYEIHARTAFSALTATASIDKIKESGTTFSSNLVEKISFDIAIRIFKEYRSEFSLFLSLNLQSLFEYIINESDNLDYNQARKIIENYQIHNREIVSQHKPLVPDFSDFCNEDAYALLEKSTIIDNYKERVNEEIKKFTQLINKIPDSAYGEEVEDNWNKWSQWIDEASNDNKDLLMHIITLTSLNLSRFYIDGEDHSQSTFIAKFKDKIFSKEILAKLFFSNSSDKIAQLIFNHRQRGADLKLLEIDNPTEDELLLFNNLQKLDDVETSIDTSHITEITHEPQNIIEFFAVLKLLNTDNIKSFLDNDQDCCQFFLNFCRSVSKEELSIILKQISYVGNEIDYQDGSLIEYFTTYLFQSTLTSAEKKYLEFIIKDVDEESITIYRTVSSYVSEEKFGVIQLYTEEDYIPVIKISINHGQDAIITHRLMYSFDQSLIDKLFHQNHYKYPYIVTYKETENTYSLLELAINIQDKKFIDRIIDYLFDDPENLCNFLNINDEEKISIIKLFQTLEHKFDKKYNDIESGVKASSFRTYAISQIINKLIDVYYNNETFKQKIIWEYKKCEIYLNSSESENIQGIIENCYFDNGVNDSEELPEEITSNAEEAYVSNEAWDESDRISEEINASLSLLQIILVTECEEQIEIDNENANIEDRIAYILTSKDISKEDIEIINMISKKTLAHVLLYHIDKLSFKDMKLFSYAVILSEDSYTIKSYIQACDEDEFNNFIRSIEEIKSLTNENHYNRVLKIIFESLTSKEASNDLYEEYQNDQIIDKLIDQKITQQYLNNIIKENDLTALSNFVKKINNYIHEQNNQQSDYDSESEDSESKGKDSEEGKDNKDYNKFFGLNFVPKDDDSTQFPRLGDDNSEHFNKSLDDSCLKLLLQINFDKLFCGNSEDSEKAKYFLRNNICDAINYLQNREDELNNDFESQVASMVIKVNFTLLSIDKLLDNESAQNHQINIDQQSEEINNGNNLLHILANNNKVKELEYISKKVTETEKQKFDEALSQENASGLTPIDILENRFLYDLANQLRPQPAAVTSPNQVERAKRTEEMSLE